MDLTPRKEKVDALEGNLMNLSSVLFKGAHPPCSVHVLARMEGFGDRCTVPLVGGGVLVNTTVIHRWESRPGLAAA